MGNEIIKIILAFVVLINPSGALSLFLNTTQDYNPQQRKKVAQIACTAVFLTLAFFTLMGEHLLNFLGISVGSFRLAGGILVFLIAINMMSGAGNPAKPDGDKVTLSGHSLAASAVVPLAIPMMIGPGGISTIIIYSSQVKTKMELFSILAAGFLISGFCYVCLMAAAKISRFLGSAGLDIMNRVMGMLLAAVAVEIFLGGLREIFPRLF